MGRTRVAKILPLPSGTVTFLFTDIEGSTKLWEAQPDAMRAAVARHDALLRQCIATHRGHVFKASGDGFCAAFATAGDAVAAALAAQRALHAERWPEPTAIRTRMALHTGAAELREGDYFGPPLNHVARLLAVGHGGQALLSAVTRDLCGNRLPAGAVLKSLGEHSLRDIARRETVFQLCHPDLPQAFPPLRTLLASIDEDVPSIAVLPFADLSPEKDHEYFTDGLAEELLNVLTKIRGLRVASRTSAFSFKGANVDIPTVAQKLNVATILEGSVRKAGKRVRITAQLVEVATDSHLWAQTYDRELEDIFAVQENIAHAVVKELRTMLFAAKPDASLGTQINLEVQAAAKGRGDNAEAYRLYLQGRFFEDRLTGEDTVKAVEYYRQALQIDPAYALGWAGLSRAYANQALFSWGTIVEGFRKARDAAGRALQLEPDLAEGHHALGVIRMSHDWDWKGADSSFRRALELAPGNEAMLRGAAALAGHLGRLDEAVGLLRHGALLDPLSVQAHRSLGRMCFFAGRLDEAEAAIGRALELNPQAGLCHWMLGQIQLARGRLDDALQAAQREPHEAMRLLGLVLAHHARGRAAESDAALRALIDKDAAGSAFQIAEAYAYRGETDLAFEWLERAYAQRAPSCSVAKVTPLLESVRGDRRWPPFLERMGLAD